jgi:hypothetical protein
MNKKEEALRNILFDRTAKGNSYIRQSWSTFRNIVDFLDGEEITKYEDVFKDFFKFRLESLLGYICIFEGMVDKANETTQDRFGRDVPKKATEKFPRITEDKMNVLKPSLYKGIQAMGGKKFMMIYEHQQNQEDKTANIFGFDFIQCAIDDPIGGKKLRAKIMEVKLGR